jgi:tetratricopeptide (TPR) repeat protein
VNLSSSHQPNAAGRHRLWIGAIGVLALIGMLAVLRFRGERFDLDGELNAAEQSLSDNDPSEARVHVQRILSHSPTHERAMFLAAKAARRADTYAEAERLLIAFEEIYKPTSGTKLEWLLLGAQQGDFASEEVRLQDEVKNRDPDTPAILEAMAKGYEASYQWPESIVVVSALLQLRPDHMPALIVRGRVRARMGQLEEAERDFRQVVEKAPSNFAAHAALAELLNRRGHTREAIQHFELALGNRPTATIRIGLARALADASDLPAAARELDALLANDPSNSDALVERGRLALRRNQFAEAESFLDRAIQAAPWHRDGNRLLLVALTEQGRSEAAAHCSARIAELKDEDAMFGRLRLRARDNKDDIAARWELWIISRRNGQSEEGFAWLTEILRSDPRHAQAHAAMAEFFARTGQPRRAAQHQALATGKAESNP